MTIVLLGTETGGLDPKKNALIQVAGIVMVDGVERERFNILSRPSPGKTLEDQALAVNGRKREEIEAFQPSHSAYVEFTSVLCRYVSKFDPKAKAFLAGYNVGFDEGFLRAWFADHNDRYFGSWFWTPSIDVMTLAGVHLSGRRQTMANFKLGTVASTMGLSADGDLHDAMVDIDLTLKVARVVAPQIFNKGA